MQPELRLRAITLVSWRYVVFVCGGAALRPGIFHLIYGLLLVFVFLGGMVCVLYGGCQECTPWLIHGESPVQKPAEVFGDILPRRSSCHNNKSFAN